MDNSDSDDSDDDTAYESPCERTKRLAEKSRSKDGVTASGEMLIGMTSFHLAFEDMEKDRKWTLSTGKVVEDALYNFGTKCSHEQ